MKIRTGFVANSSSSSFVCEVCGETEVGYNSSPRDFEMEYCVNGHIVCNEHLLDEMTEDEETKYDEEDCEVPERICPICQFQVLSQPEVVTYLIETRGVSKEEVFEKVKEMNKRRKKLYDSEYINYVGNKFNLTENMILEELKSKFKTYKDFQKRNY
jgi:hypothetical protein